MLRGFRRSLRNLYENSPRENLQRARARAAGRDAGSKVMPEWEKDPDLLALVSAKIREFNGPVVLLGGDSARALGSTGLDPERQVQHVSWGFDSGAGALELGAPELDWESLSDDTTLVVCHQPSQDSEWRAIQSLKQRHSGPVVGIQELVLPLTTLQLASDRLDYYADSFEQVACHYRGESLMAGVEDLDGRFALAGRRIFEFGPLDGCQTAAMVKLGAREIACIEARAENALKTLVAAYSMGWQNVGVSMDDFHNADANRYGRFDLAFAHGVYYHSNAPFVLFENLLSLADHVYLGGFCASDELPRDDWEKLEHEDRSYRVKRYRETNNITAGVNEYGYFFHPEDLARFFRDRGCQVETISDEASSVTAGRYVRLLATRTETASD
jgi:hypothetical protein